MGFVKAIKSDDLPLPLDAPGGFSMPAIRKVNVSGRELLVTRLGTGKAVAFATHCPHQGTPLDRAVLIGDQLRCPQHNYVYDPTTGHNVRPSVEAKSEALVRLKPGYLPTFTAEEKEGWVWISQTPNPAPQGRPPRPMPPPSRNLPPPISDETPSKEPLEPTTVTVGDAFDLELSTMPAPGHIWRLESNLGLVKLNGQMFDENKRVYRLNMTAAKSGTETSQLMFGKPWGGRPSRVLTLNITVLERPEN